MKTLYKYITLLVFSGVIIPIYQQAVTIKPAPATKAVIARIETPAQPRGFHLYFLNEVAAKLLPVADFFK
jgi:hypothetical protein